MADGWQWLSVSLNSALQLNREARLSSSLLRSASRPGQKTKEEVAVAAELLPMALGELEQRITVKSRGPTVFFPSA